MLDRLRRIAPFLKPIVILALFAIAWAIVEHLHDRPERGTFVLFATHYHELTELAEQLSGVRNLICITGDPPKMGNYPDATAVFDVDAIGLVNIVHNLNRGLDIGATANAIPRRPFVRCGSVSPPKRTPGAASHRRKRG